MTAVVLLIATAVLLNASEGHAQSPEVEAAASSPRLHERADALCSFAKEYDQQGGQEREVLTYYRRCAAHPGAERFRDHAKARIYAIEQAHIERKLALRRGRHEAPEQGLKYPEDDSELLMTLGFGALGMGGVLLIGSALVAADTSSEDQSTLATALLIGGAITTMASIGLLLAALIESDPDRKTYQTSIAFGLSPATASLRIQGNF